MFVIEVIPLTLLPPNVPQILSYFFDQKLERGAVVRISIGGRSVKAIVADSIPLTEHKIGLKKAEFQLKKLSEVLTETPQISNRQFRIALWLSKTYYSPLGMCLKAVLPPFFLKKKYPLNPEPEMRAIEKVKRKPDLILTDAKNALKNALPLVKGVIGKSGQAVLVVPDNQTIDYFYKNLSKEYETVKVSSGSGNKAFFSVWSRLTSRESATSQSRILDSQSESGQKAKSDEIQIIIGTRQALLLPFKNLHLVIVDDPLHEFYKSDMSPKYNTADLAGYIAEMNNCRLVYLSPITGVENYFLLKNREYELTDKTQPPTEFLGRLKHGQETTPRPQIKTVNMVSEIKSGNFSLLSRELKSQILSLVNPAGQNKKILIFSPRRGHSGILVCQNCGWTAKCPNCEAAYKIHRANDLVLMCHHCGGTQRLPDHCPNCNSSKLKPTGPAGSQKIYEEIKGVLSQNETSGVPVLILDTDVTANQTEEEEVMGEIAKPKTSILIATQMIFSYRYEINFDFVAVMNVDSMIQMPDFRTEERLFYQLEKLFDFKPEQMLIQTFNPENQAILTASRRNYNWQRGRNESNFISTERTRYTTYKEFYEKELAIRQALSYPPFSRLIKLTFRHPDRETASREARVLAGKLKMAVVQLKLSDKIKITDSAPGFLEKERGLYTYNIVVKSLTGQTPREILKYVPSRWLIDVDPRTLL